MFSSMTIPLTGTDFNATEFLKHNLQDSHHHHVHYFYINELFNPSAWGHLKPSSYCNVGRFFYRVFKFWAKLCRSSFKI